MKLVIGNWKLNWHWDLASPDKQGSSIGGFAHRRILTFDTDYHKTRDIALIKDTKKCTICYPGYSHFTNCHIYVLCNA
jgi:hypothetical protein